MKYDELPDAERKAVDRAIGRRSSTKERTRPRPSRAEIPAGDGDPGGSCVCGENFPTYKAWEKHNAANPDGGHSRWNIAVTPAP